MHSAFILLVFPNSMFTPFFNMKGLFCSLEKLRLKINIIIIIAFLIAFHIHIHIGRLARMSVLDTEVEPRQQYVVSSSKTLYPHCFSRLSCEMSTRWGQPREGCSVL